LTLPASALPLRVLLLYGTRPEAIKMAPVVATLRRRPDQFALTVCTTAQHRAILDQVQGLFALRPDLDLDLMRPDQSPNQLAARAFAALDGVLVERRPDWLLVQGDTTTAMVGAFAAFHRRVRVGHVEAGLRTGDLERPSPRRPTGAWRTCSPTLFSRRPRRRGGGCWAKERRRSASTSPATRSSMLCTGSPPICRPRRRGTRCW
jgi:hypothetical protein